MANKTLKEPSMIIALMLIIFASIVFVVYVTKNEKPRKYSFQIKMNSYTGWSDVSMACDTVIKSDTAYHLIRDKKMFCTVVPAPGNRIIIIKNK